MIFGGLTAICALAGFVVGLDDGKFMDAVGTGFGAAVVPGIFWLLTYVNKIA